MTVIVTERIWLRLRVNENEDGGKSEGGRKGERDHTWPEVSEALIFVLVDVDEVVIVYEVGEGKVKKSKGQNQRGDRARVSRKLSGVRRFDKSDWEPDSALRLKLRGFPLMVPVTVRSRC